MVMPKTVNGITIQWLCRRHSTAYNSKLNGYAEDIQRHNSKLNGYAEDIERHNHQIINGETIQLQVEW